MCANICACVHEEKECVGVKKAKVKVLEVHLAEAKVPSKAAAAKYAAFNKVKQPVQTLSPKQLHKQP